MRIRYVLLILLAMLPIVAGAGEAQPLIADPVLEKRVMALSSELRCLVCQGQSLAESHADFAADMRKKILELMQDGKTDQQVVDFLVARYGDFIRFRPPVKATTVLLWLGPAILVLLALSVLTLTIKKRQQRSASAPLSSEERKRLESLLHENTGDSKA